MGPPGALIAPMIDTLVTSQARKQRLWQSVSLPRLIVGLLERFQPLRSGIFERLEAG